MWTSNFPLCALLLLLGVLDPAFGNEQNDSLSVLAPKITQFKLSLHHLLEGARIRRKRQYVDPNAPHEQQMRFSSSAQEDLPYLSDYNLTFWIPVVHQSQKQALIATKQGHLILFELVDNDEKFAKTIAVSEDEDMIIKAKAFSHYDEQWFVALQSDTSGLHHIRLYQKIGRGLEKRQTITLNGHSEIDLITVRNVHYLVVATYQTKTNQGYSYRAEVKLYHWTESQFDEIASRVTYGATSVSCWVLDGSLYMAVGQERDDEGDYSIGSPVFLYNAKEKNKLVMLEKLATFGPKRVLHFYVSNNHYAIFIGVSEAVIYWWSSGQFLAWQTIKGTANAVDVSVLTLENGEAAIVIALAEEALFLTLDVSGYYIISFVMSFAGSSLSSLQFMYSGQAYYALAVFAESFRHRSHSIYKLTVEPYNLMTGSSLDSLQECLSSMNELLDERETELTFVKSELGRVWLKGQNQRITSSVHVTGGLGSTLNTIVRQVLILVEHKLLVDWPSRDEVIEELSKAKSLTSTIRNDLDDLVLKSPTQEITGTLQFLEPIAIPSLNMKSSDLDVVINGVFVSLLNYALRKNGDQTFFGSIMADNIHTEQLKLDSLNGIFINDLLLLRGQQTVAGLLKFFNVLTSSLSVSNLNSIPVENIVLTNSDQEIADLKSASYLNSLVIDVHGQTNGKNLEEMQNKIVLTNTDDIMGRLTWNSPITIAGNLFAPGLINGEVDLSTIAQNSVQKHSQQDLTGTLFFTTPQSVSEDMTVTGSINDVYTQHLLTKDTAQAISGSVVFSEPLSVRNDLFTDSVNGIDLSESAVLKSPSYTYYDQFVSGFKMFADDLNVDSVDMTEYVTLDGVDPSLLVQDIVRHKAGVVKENRTTFGSVVVTGDVTALGGLNGHEVMDLQHMFWLKSKPQTIEADVRLDKMSVGNDLEVEQINLLNLDNDVVRSFGNETIDSEKSFNHIINVKRLDHSRGVLINGIDIFSFKTELEREDDDWTVHGIKIFKTIEVLGDLSMKELDELHGSKELMQVKAPQTVLGEMGFSSEITNVLSTTKAHDLLFDTINGINFRNYLEHAIKSPSSRTISDKEFSYLAGSNMQLEDGSTIGAGKTSLFEFLPRIVTLNSVQDIISPKIFNSAVHLANNVAVTDLNGLDVSSYASRVVLKDGFKTISARKEFSGIVEMKFIFVQNYVNGIKIEKLAENAFSKTGDNEVTASLSFFNDIDIGQLLTNSINGLNLSNLALTNRDEILGSTWFLSDVKCFGGLFVTGYINGCDLSMIQRFAFYTNKTQHVIGTEISVDTIQVLGNIEILNNTSHSQIEMLKRNLILISEEEVLEADMVIDSNAFAINLNVANFVNGVYLPFLFNDAVRFSVPQEVKGFKIFNDLTTSILRSRGIFVQGNFAGVNMQELLRRAVLKRGHQTIAGEKIFQSASLMVDVATVQGRLNSLHLPQDVVLTDTSEIITSPTFFMSDMYLNNELTVGGRIDGVDIDEFLKNRISLTSEQTILSALTFWEEVVIKGNLGINGMINDLALEMVVNLRRSHPIGGYKSFINLKVTGSVQAPQVNGYDPVKLVNDILKFNKEEIVNEIQVFEKPLQVNSLFADWINGISVSQLSLLAYSIRNGLRSILNVFEGVTFAVQEQLGHQLSSSGTQLSKFSYFILVQELDLGSASKILHGYRFEHPASEFSHSMVIWTSQRHCANLEKCCETEFTYWMRVRRSGHVMVDGEAEMGRYYPIHNPAPVTYDKDFFMWTNTTQLQPKWCRGKGKGKMQLASFTNDAQMQVFMEIANSPTLSEVKTFRSGSLYAVAGFFYDPVEGEYRSTVVYSFNEVKREWSEHQILPSFGVLSLDITTGKNGEILLALGTGMETTQESYSVIYKWSDDEKQFDVSQSVSTRFVTSTVWIHHEASLFLAMSGVDHWPKKDTDCFEHVSGGQINIYLYDGYARWIQSIPLEGVASMVSFNVEGDTFLAAASSQLQTVNIYEHKGYAGFALMQSIFAGEVRHLNTYSIDSDLFMTVAKASGSSEILKAVTQGKSDPAHLGYRRLTQDQNDETSLEEKIVSRCR